MHNQPETNGNKPVVLGLATLFLVYLINSYFMQTIGVARPRMAAELDGMSLYSWAISIPGLAAALVTLIFSKFSDMYGRRIMLLVSLGLFLAGTIWSAISPTFVTLIAANTLARLGSGAIAPLVFSVLGDMFSPVQRSKWVGLLNIPAGIFALVGPTLGGWFVDNVSWRSIYWTGAPLLVLCLLAVPIGLPPRTKSIAHKIDVRGCIFMAVACSTTIIAFSLAGTTYPWASVQIIGLLAVSLIFWVLFLRTETRAKEPILDPQVFQNRTFLMIVLAGFMSNFGLTAMMVYFPLFLQGVQGISATQSGQILTPFGVLMAFVGVPTGFLLARTKRYKWLFILSYGIVAAVLFGTVFLRANTPVFWNFVVAMIGGLGFGAVPTIKTIVVQFIVPKRLLGVATGALFFTVSMGLTISPAILGSIMNVAYENNLKTVLPGELKQVANSATLNSIGNPRVLLSKTALKALETDLKNTGLNAQFVFEETVQAIRISMEAGLRMVFMIGAAGMLLAFLLIMTIPEISMEAEVEDSKIHEKIPEAAGAVR